MKHSFRDTLITVFFTVVMAVIVAATLVVIFRYSPEEKIITLEEGWTVQLEDGEELRDVKIKDLPDRVEGDLKRGEKLVLSIGLPEETAGYSTPTIFESSHHNIAKAYLDDKLIFSEFDGDIEKAGFISRKDNYIDLSGVKPGDEFRLEYVLTETVTEPEMEAPKFGNYLDLQRSFLIDNVYFLFAGLFLIVFGLFFMIVSLILQPLFPEIIGQLTSSAISMIFGVYIITSTRVSPIFFHSGHTGDVEYVAFYLIAPFMYYLFSQIHEVKLKKLYSGLSILTAVLVVIFIALHFADVVHMNTTLPLYYVLITVMTIVLLVYDARDIKERKYSANNVIQMAGPTLFCIAFICCITYSLFKLVVLRSVVNDYVFMTIFTTGCLAFALSRLMVYFIYLSETDQRREEFNALTHKVYHDALTDAFNRNSYAEAIRDMNEGNENYGILSIRMEGLSNIVNVKGHGKSDEWLRSFGKAIVINTPDNGGAFRTDADTFAIIVRDNERGPLEHVVENLNRAMRVMDYNEPEIPHVITCGIAYSDEGNRSNAAKIAELADSRRTRT